jgi:hypothetical protein
MAENSAARNVVQQFRKGSPPFRDAPTQPSGAVNQELKVRPTHTPQHTQHTHNAMDLNRGAWNASLVPGYALQHLDRLCCLDPPQQRAPPPPPPPHKFIYIYTPLDPPGPQFWRECEDNSEAGEAAGGRGGRPWGTQTPGSPRGELPELWQGLRLQGHSYRPCRSIPG